MNTQELLALADRCEREEPSRALDAAIAESVGERVNRIGNTPLCRPYTTSLDAAVTLSIGWVLVTASDIGADGLPLVVLADPSTTPAREAKGMGGRTLVLTWCAAALKARAAIAERAQAPTQRGEANT